MKRRLLVLAAALAVVIAVVTLVLVGDDDKDTDTAKAESLVRKLPRPRGLEGSVRDVRCMPKDDKRWDCVFTIGNNKCDATVSDAGGGHLEASSIC